MAPPKRRRSPQRPLLSAQTYKKAFGKALEIVIALKPGGLTSYQLNESRHDERLSNDRAADADFYPSFEFRRNGVMAYTRTKSFFDLSLAGFEPTAQPLQGELRQAFLIDCATNYLVKNFWHNIVHEQMQRITSSNYTSFREEARYSSDFDADCLATTMLAFSYGHNVRTDVSRQVAAPDANLQRLFLRNRCNRVFPLREQARERSRAARRSVTLDDLLEREWLIRRLLVNELCMRCLERGRALASVSVHFFGTITRKKGGHYERPDAGAAVEMNGVRIPLRDLGNFAYSERSEIKIAVERYVTALDNEYAGLLRAGPSLLAYARMSLEARVGRLISAALVSNTTGMRVRGLKVAGGSGAGVR